ncbi:hypothetical protein RIF29_20713 [Crotalaria pallida]|uniref:Uncharacterized protein n=1 Tax=Crotalaria pallida TaxID=3830 RepID=A0AAN9I8X8_CROPI
MKLLCNIIPRQHSVKSAAECKEFAPPLIQGKTTVESCHLWDQRMYCNRTRAVGDNVYVPLSIPLPTTCRFVETCLNTELDTITLRGKKANGDAVEKVCGLYIHGGNHRIINQWRDFCQEMDIQAGYGLLLEVVNGAQNIVTVDIEDDGDDEWEEEE